MFATFLGEGKTVSKRNKYGQNNRVVCALQPWLVIRLGEDQLQIQIWTVRCHVEIPSSLVDCC